MQKHTAFKGGKMHYSIGGKGQCLVLLHGFLESMEIWARFSRKLTRSFRVICIDLPGHGKSETEAETITMEFMADGVNTVLKQEGIRNCSVVGHSMGGYVALAFAEKYLKKVRGLVLFHSQAMADSREAMRNRDRMVNLVEKDRQGFITSFIPGMFDPGNVERLKKDINRLKDMALVTPVKGISGALKGMKIRPDRTYILAQAPFPVLFIIGKNDPKLPLEDLIPQTTLPSISEVLMLDHVGHMGFIEAPSQTFTMLEGFSKKVLG